MKFTAKKLVLQSLFNKAFSVAPKTGLFEVYQNVRLSCNDRLEFFSVDGQIALKGWTDELSIEEMGVVNVPPDIREIVKLCADSDITFKSDEDSIYIDCENAHWGIKQDLSEFPDVIMIPTSDFIDIPKDFLGASIARCRPAINSDTVQDMFNYIHIKDGRMQASDGSKLHQVSFPHPVMDGLLPARAIPDILRRIKSTASDVVSVNQDNRMYIFKFDRDTLFVLKHVTEYPDVDDHMIQPAYDNNTDTVNIPLPKFRDAVKRVSLTSDSETQYMVMDFHTNLLKLSSFDRYGNNSIEEIEVDWTFGYRKFGVNHRHLIDVLSSLEGDGDVSMRVGQSDGDKLSSLLFIQGDFVGILMQLRSDLMIIPSVSSGDDDESFDY